MLDADADDGIMRMNNVSVGLGGESSKGNCVFIFLVTAFSPFSPFLLSFHIILRCDIHIHYT